MAAWWESLADFGNDVVDTVSDYGNQAYDAVSDYGNQAYDAVSDYGNQAYDAVSDYGNQAYESLGDFGSRSYNPTPSSTGLPSFNAPGNGGGDPSLGGGLTPSFTQGSGSSAGLGLNRSGGMQFTTAGNTPATSGVTGGFGVTPGGGAQPYTPSMLSGGYGAGGDFTIGAGGNTGGFNSPPSTFQRGVSAVEGGIDRVQDFARKNTNTARLGIDAAGMLLGYKNRNDANDLAQEQMQMQRAGLNKNAAMADKMNSQATQSMNEARSLYNPQELAMRSMASTKMANQRAQDQARTQMQKAGKNKATIDAEMRRAQLSGTTGANTSYLRGLDTGRVAQQGALSSAAGLTRNYATGADFSGADRVAQAGQSDSAQLTAMLNRYMGDPVYQQNAEAQRRAQQDAYNYSK